MQQHPAGLLTIDLDAIQENWLTLKRQLNGADCAAVVKADAYGLGMVPVARALERVGCRQFFVVNQDEGHLLRQALGSRPTIYLLQGATPGLERECGAAGLIPVLVCREAVERWLQFGEAQGASAEWSRCALKVNTGMNRLGLDPAEVAELAEKGKMQRLNCELLMSHLACADEFDHPLNQVQWDCFQNVLKTLRHLFPQVQASLANSAACLRGEQWHFDLVRPGIALYGANATGLPQHRMQPVVKLELPVVQTRCVSKGDRIGYGATYTAPAAMEVAVVTGGYGDGLFRSLGNSGCVWFDRKLPVIGRVSMDSFVVDMSQLTVERRPRVGDMVEVLGPHITVDEMAESAGTIPYEVLTRLYGRYQRRYLLQGEFVDQALQPVEAS